MAHPTETKVLSVLQPFAWAIIFGGKDVENRTWQTKYRGPIYIHASLSKRSLRQDSPVVEQLSGKKIPTDDLPFMAIIGMVTLADCVENHPSDWASPGEYHWVLRNAVALVEPIRCRGALNLWTPPTDAIARLKSTRLYNPLTHPELNPGAGDKQLKMF